MNMADRDLGSPLNFYYDVTVEGESLGYTKEHEECRSTKEITEAKDTFPCGHILCHHCLRKHVISYRRSAWCCPVCYKEQTFWSSEGQPTVLTYDDNNNDDQDTITLMSNLDDVVEKFNGINYTKRTLKRECVQTKNIGLTYTRCVCDMCDESHPTMRVVQDYSRLQVEHQRPRGLFYQRLSQSSIVTTFHSKVSSSCVCVPCTFREIQANPTDFQYALPEESQKGDRNNNPSMTTALAEVGKLVTKQVTPIKALRGKNVLDVEHTFRYRDRADHFDFNEVTQRIKQGVRRNEKDMVKIYKREIEDTGELYHVKEQHSIDYNMGETVV